MRSALHLLVLSGFDGRDWPNGEPMFIIRGRRVSFGQIRTYYRRKNIYKLFEWHLALLAQSSTEFQLDPDVILLPPPAHTSISDPEIIANPILTTFLEHTTLESAEHIAEEISNNSSESWSDRSSSLDEDVPRTIASPKPFRQTERLISLATSYCSYYLNLSQIRIDLEPTVHLETDHGRFGHEVQDGVATILYHSNYAKAMALFDRAFGRLKDILKSDHPMGLAQVLAVTCELASRVATTGADAFEQEKRTVLQRVLDQLLDYTAKLAAMVMTQTQTHPVKAIFAQLTKVEQIRDQVLAFMQRMVELFAQTNLTGQDKPLWKLLYLKERYCDCLYHAGADGTRQVVRSQLLTQQEEFYGKLKSNVLWTLTNVGDDHLYSNRPLKAEGVFLDALCRAESLGGYAKAKIRFAALEGLAKTACWNAHTLPARASLDWCATRSVKLREPPAEMTLYLLQRADIYCSQAEAEAAAWFGAENRRQARISRRRSEIDDEVQMLMCTM